MRSAAQHWAQVAGTRLRGRLNVLALVLGLAIAVASPAQEQSFTETVLYSFTGGSDGADPLAGLVRDAAGNLYGTTSGGGASGAGTVFKVTAGGAESVLHSFTGGADGRNPYAGLVRDRAGNLYGTTNYGGVSGHGTVFKLDTTGKEIVLHSFSGGADGEYPSAGLVRDAAGKTANTLRRFDPGRGGEPLRHHLWRRCFRLGNDI